MSIDRESIYQALFAKLSAIDGLKTKSRKLKHWNDVGPAQQPALFVAHKNEHTQPKQGMPPIKTLTVDVYVYVKTTGNQIPSTVLSKYLAAVDDVLKPDTAPFINKCTLGGLVEHCWIEGTTETDEGTLGDQAVAIIPIHILTANTRS